MPGLMKQSLTGVFTLFITGQTAFSVTRLQDSSSHGLPESQQATENKSHISRGSDYTFRIGVGKPSFSDINYYEDFYGSTEMWFDIGFSWNYLSTEYVSLGLGTKLGFYSAGGSQMQVPQTDNPASLDKAEGKLSLTLAPFQLLLTGSYRPFGSNSWLSFGFWTGYEELYFQEVRSDSSSTDTTTSSSSPRTLLNATSDTGTDTSTKRVMNTGWNTAVVVGASMDILLNSLDPKNVRSMQKTMGLGGIYISPFFEMTMGMNGKAWLAGKDTSKVQFAHSTFGVAFNFTTSF